MANNFIMPSRMDPRRRYVERKCSGNAHYLCTEHGNPLVSVRAESCEGSSHLDKLCVMFEAAPDMLAALQAFVDLFGREDAYQGDPAGLACVRAARAAIAKATGKEG